MLPKLKGYLMGPHTGKDPMEMIRNIRHGLELNRRVRNMGFLTYCPWSDFLEALVLIEKDCDSWKQDALEELLRCDFAVLADMNPRWKESSGTIDELATCFKNGIPLFYESSLHYLIAFEAEYRSYQATDQEDDGEMD